MTTKNLLTSEEQSFSSSSALWRPVVVANTSLSRSVVHYNSEPASMLMVSRNGLQMAARLDREIPIVPGKRYRIFCSAFSETADHPFGISCSVYSRSGTNLLTETGTSETVFGRWKTASKEFVAPESSASVNISVFAESSHLAVSGETVSHTSIWIDDVVMAEWGEYPANDFAVLAQRHVPEYMLELDDDDPVKPLRRYMDVVTSTADEIMSAVKAFDYIPEVDGITGYERSTLVDPSYYPDPLVAKREWLPWLAQLVGVRGISAGSSGLTPWFWLEQAIGTWEGMETQIDPSSNPVWGLVDFSLERSSNTVTATLSSQTGGADPYFPQVGDVVEVTAEDAEFEGSFSITASDNGTMQVSWEQEGADHTDTSVGGTASIRISDASWVEIEGANPLAFDTVGVLAELVRTRATGIKAGSRYAIKAAGRSVLDGFDDTASIGLVGGTSNLMVTTQRPHSLSVGSFVEVYDCPEVPYNSQYTVSAVLSPTVFTVSSPYGSNDPHMGESFPCWVTNKKVEILVSGEWNMTYRTTEAQTYALGLLEQAVSLAKPAGMIATHQYTT